MYIIRNKATHTPLKRVVTFTQHNNVKGDVILTFQTNHKAKHFMRNKKLEKRYYEILFMTGKEMEKLR